MVERMTLNHVVVGSIPTVGVYLIYIILYNIRISLAGQDNRLSPDRPGFKSRMRNIFLYIKLIQV